MIIERYLDNWRDFIHLMCTCKQLYFEWVSKDTERWKRLRLPHHITKRVLHVFVPKNTNPTIVIRKRALDSYLHMDILSYAKVPCMGGCGRTIRASETVSMQLSWAVCQKCAECAKSCPNGCNMIQTYFKRNGFTNNPSTVAFEYAYTHLGEEKWLKNKEVISRYWTTYYVQKLKKQHGWTISVFKIRHVQETMLRLINEL